MNKESFERRILLKERSDKFDIYRQEYNDMLKKNKLVLGEMIFKGKVYYFNY